MVKQNSYRWNTFDRVALKERRGRGTVTKERKLIFTPVTIRIQTILKVNHTASFIKLVLLEK